MSRPRKKKSFVGLFPYWQACFHRLFPLLPCSRAISGDMIRWWTAAGQGRSPEFAGMTEYQIEANTRRCVVSGRELQAGEKFFSVLLDRDGKFIRQDFGSESWQGPPDGAFSFWTGKVPVPDDKRRTRIDDELLIDCFHRLEADTEPAKVNFRYVLALLLMRGKRLRF